MNIELTPEQARVIGCLMEKSVTTPDQYPLTLNALTAACNQKTSREPVMALETGEVQRTARQLEDLYLVSREENFRSGVEKYSQRLCNTLRSRYQFEPPEFALVCLLLLRGPQTPGELRSRSGRLHDFPDNAAVADTLQRLADHEDGPLVTRLPRVPGRHDAQYAHLFSGTPEPTTAATEPPPRRETTTRADLEARVAALEAQLAALTARLDALAPPDDSVADD